MSDRVILESEERSIKRKARRRKWNLAHHDPEKHRIAVNLWRRQNPAAARIAEQVYRYKLSREQLKMLKSRDTDCAICHSDKRLTIDHDHSTDVVRGRLCQRCNRKLNGLDDAAWVEAAKMYLQERAGGWL